jgi:hypothetical protein
MAVKRLDAVGKIAPRPAAHGYFANPPNSRKRKPVKSPMEKSRLTSRPNISAELVSRIENLLTSLPLPAIYARPHAADILILVIPGLNVGGHLR